MPGWAALASFQDSFVKDGVSCELSRGPGAGSTSSPGFDLSQPRRLTVTDERLRDLARSSVRGTHSEVAHFLMECVRSGVVTKESLDVAAYVGHEGARLAYGMTGGPWSSWDEQGSAYGLRRWGSEITLRAAYSVAALAFATHERRLVVDGANIQRQAYATMDAVGTWLAAPATEAAREHKSHCSLLRRLATKRWTIDRTTTSLMKPTHFSTPP